MIHQLPSGLSSSTAEKGECSRNHTLPPVYSSNIILTRMTSSCDCTHPQNICGCALQPQFRTVVFLAHPRMQIRIPLSYPVMILSPVTSEPVHLWNDTNRCFWWYHNSPNLLLTKSPEHILARCISANQWFVELSISLGPILESLLQIPMVSNLQMLSKLVLNMSLVLKSEQTYI